MYKTIITAALWITALILLPLSAEAQFDDLYYNPDNQRHTTTTTTTTTSTTSTSQDLSFGDREYDDQSYEYFDDYDFYYSSRIKRFHRPMRNRDFYDPYFVDLAYYGYARPGVTIYMSSMPFRYGSMHHHHHFHYYDPFYHPHYAFHRPFRPYRPFGYSPYRYGYGYGSMYGGWGCPIFYTSQTYYVNNYYNPGPSQGSDVATRGTQYGPRSVTGGAAPRSGRSADAENRTGQPPSDERSTSGNQLSGADTPQQRNGLSSGERGSRSSSESATEQRRGDRSSANQMAATSLNAREASARQAQNRFRDQRVNRDQSHTDRRTNVPSTDRQNRSGVNPRQTSPATRGNNPRGNIQTDQPRGNQNRSHIDRSNNRTNPSSDVNRGRNNNQNQGSFSNPRSNNRSSGVNSSRTGRSNSSGVSPSRNNNRSSNSNNTSSGRSGRGG